MPPAPAAEPAHPLVRLARQAIESFVRHGQVIEPAQPLPPGLEHPRATFVTLRIAGELRGCIGTIQPMHHTVAHEVVYNAISACSRDPRFAPVRVDELPLLCYSVDLLHPPEPIEHIDQLDPQRYGVIVSAGRRRGLLLPHIPGIDAPALQVALAARKAGIDPAEPLQLQRFLADKLT